MIPSLQQTKEIKAKLKLISDVLWKDFSGSRVIHSDIKKTILCNALLISALEESDDALQNKRLPVSVTRSHLQFRKRLVAVSIDRIEHLLNVLDELRIK
ncbi:hypothetical protein VCSRO136_2229 [Vibrio cholerae]|nr:hypothetical protein VCSRO136_2229 [Vibrio cholerae]